MLRLRLSSSASTSAALALAIGTAILSSCSSKPSHPPVTDDSAGAHAPVATGGGTTPATTTDAGAPSGTLATAPTAIRGVAVTASDTYFIYVDPGDGGLNDDGGTNGGGVLARVPRGGGTTQTVVTGGTSPRALAIADGSLYWIDDGASGSAIVRFGASSLGTVLSGLTSSSVFAARSDVIVVATASIGSVSIDRAPNGDGGVVQSLGSVLGEASPLRVLLDASNAYVLVRNALGGTLYRVALVGSVPEELWTAGSGTVNDLAIDSGHALVSWDRGTAADGEIISIPLAGGAPQPFVSPVQGPNRLAIDGADLFYTTGDGSLARVALAGGGSPTTLASGLGAPAAIAVADAVYVASGPNLVRVAR